MSSEERLAKVERELAATRKELADLRAVNKFRALLFNDEALKKLTYREREIIKLRYGLSDGQVYLLRDVGRIFRVSHESVRQIETRAIRKLQRRIKKAEHVEGEVHS